MQSGRAYYNENDPYAAQWLRNLIAAGLIAPGDVDDRSIVDVKPDDLIGYSQCHFFAGIGGWSLALRAAGWSDDRRVWTGSCPCQPFSVAGKRKGFDDARHLFPVWSDLIEKCGPSVVFGEQVAAASEWLGTVRGHLEGMEYAVGCMPIEAASAGADHLRDRYWFVADAGGPGSFPGAYSGVHLEQEGTRLRDVEPERLCILGNPDSQGHALGIGITGVHGQAPEQTERQAAVQASHIRDLADADGQRCEEWPEFDGRSIAGRESSLRDDAQRFEWANSEWVIGADGKARRVKSGIRLLAHGVSARVGKLRAFGNAIDPRPASAFITAYMDFCLERTLLQ